jgi:ketosteroid isomerase-like protein
METLIHYGQKVNQMYEAFNRRDINTIINSLSQDCIWESMGQPEVPYAGIYHGQDDVRQFFQKLDDCLDISEFTLEHILENGNLVIATGHMNAAGKETGRRCTTIWAMTFEFDNQERVVHFRDCYDTLAVARAVSDTVGQRMEGQAGQRSQMGSQGQQSQGQRSEGGSQRQEGGSRSQGGSQRSEGGGPGNA